MRNFLRQFALVAVVAASWLAVSAEIPTGYYSRLKGKSGADLKTAVFEVINPHTTVSSYSNLPQYFQKTDVYPSSRRWWDMYSNVVRNAPSFSGLNREHAFPKSWWKQNGSVEYTPAYVDLNHLYPGDGPANQAKSNYPLGVTGANPKFNNGVTKVGYPVAGQGGGAQYVFEPADEYKGDFARTYFYMVTCYQDLTWKYTFMVNQNLYPTLNQWSVDLLMAWHRQDPVSQKEIDRNEVVFGIQNNRNPFIDHPELAEYLWGTKKGESFSPGEIVVPPVGEPELIAPVKDMSLDFGQVALGHTSRTLLFVKGNNLNGTVDLAMYTGDARMFSVPSKVISASVVNSEGGYWLEVSYTPTEIGKHSSRIVLSGDFGSRGVALIGECLPVPTLSACTATEATDISSDRYTANWTAPENEEIDYYVVTRTRYSGSDVVTEELVAEDTSLEIVGFDESDRESYSVQSVRLDVRSPMSNVVYVDHSGIQGVESGRPLIVQSFRGMIRFICSEPQTNACIYDISGRLVMTIATVGQDYDQALSEGVYFIVTDQHRTPVRVYVQP